MSKFWRIVAFEYGRHVLRRRFLFGLLSVPLIIGVMALVVLLMFWIETDGRPAGYVDRSGLLADPLPPPRPRPPDPPVELRPYDSETAAEAALQAGAIQAYFVLEPDYLQTGRARAVSMDALSNAAASQFRAFVRANLLADQPEEVRRRLVEGDELVVRSADGRREMGESDWLIIFVPFFAGFAFMVAMFATSGYLMQAVVEEKENRTMEVLVTSVSPLQLLAGKVTGIIGVGWTQLLVWLSVAWAGVLVGRNYFAWMEAIRIDAAYTGLLLATFIPAFVMISALMAAVGSTVTEAQEGQQITGLFTLPVVVPYWFTYQIMSNPHGPLAVVMSFFPLTAPVALTMRAGFTFIPLWQVLVSVGILFVCALAALWLAGRAFRLGMLRYGQRLGWRELFGRPAAPRPGPQEGLPG
jgi:ABC-2 type transport system permease protein